MTPPTPHPKADETLRAVERLGEVWAEKVLADLACANRRPTGMWPGTLSEARGLFDRWASTAPDARGAMRERQQFVRALNAAARSVWQRRRVHEGDGPDLDL